MRKLFIMAAAVFLAAAMLVPVQALSAEKAILLDGNTGRIMFEKDADSKSLIASTTKIMTALVVCRRCNVLDRIRIPREAVGIEGSSMYLREGEVLTIQDLLYGLMLQSGNDAAVALAIYCGGTLEGFAQLMNDTARLLGMKNSHFVNPHGLDAPDHYSTARDLAILASAAMGDPIFAKTVATKSVRAGERSLTNHNKLLWRVDGVNGIKTGYTKAAGRILVSSAKRNGRQLIAVTINASDDWNDHTQLLEYGFSGFKTCRIVCCEQKLGTVQVAWGDRENVSLIAADDFDFSIAEGESVSIELPGQGFVYAPVSKGQYAGSAHILIDGVPVGSVNLLYGETTEQIKEQEKSFFENLFGGNRP